MTEIGNILDLQSEEGEQLQGGSGVGRSLLRQVAQIRQSETYDDTLSMVNAEVVSGIYDLESDLNFLRSQIKVVTGETNWNDAPDLSLQNIHDKAFLRLVQVVPDTSVPASQNYVVLSGTNLPSEVMAINSSTLGAVTAELVGAVGSHATTTASNNGNLVAIRDAALNDIILDGENEIFGLLQVANGQSDGGAFADNQAQISFVTFNPSTEALQAATVAAIENKTIEYQYRSRKNFGDLNEYDFLSETRFIDRAASVDVTLDNAYEGGQAATVDVGDVDWQLANTNGWKVTDGSTQTFLDVTRNDSTGDTADVTVDTLTLTTTNDVTSTQGFAVDSSTQTLNLGVTAGSIDSSSLELQSNTGNLTLVSAADLAFSDQYATSIVFSDASNTTLPNSYSSILDALNSIYDLASGGGHNMNWLDVNGTYIAGTNIGAAQVTGTLLAYTTAQASGGDFKVFLNGQVLRYGSTNDWYAGTDTTTNGELKFTFAINTNDVITVEKHG